MKKYTTLNPQQTKAVARLLAKKLRGGEILALRGNLGSGKTTFIKGLARALGVKQTITSPTFVLMKVYNTNKGKIKQFVHVDCYRLPTGRYGVAKAEFTQIGLNDYFKDPHTVVAIEWAEKLKLKKYKPKAIKFWHGKKKNERIITCY